MQFSLTLLTTVYMPYNCQHFYVSLYQINQALGACSKESRKFKYYHLHKLSIKLDTIRLGYIYLNHIYVFSCSIQMFCNPDLRPMVGIVVACDAEFYDKGRHQFFRNRLLVHVYALDLLLFALLVALLVPMAMTPIQRL